MTDQYDIFAQPKHEEVVECERGNLRQKTAIWLAKYPEIAQMFLDLAREEKAYGIFGIQYLAEVIRYKYRVKYNERFKICNSYTAYIARWLIKQDPSLEDFMKFRMVRY